MVEITQSEKGHGSDDDFAELHLLYNYSDDDSRQFTRWHMAEAISHGRRITKLATIAALEQPTPEMVEDTAKGIEGPRCAVPDNSPHTLEELQEARWKMLSTQEQATRREEAKAALAAAAKCLKEPTQ